MKKFLLSFLVVLLCAVIALSLVACGDNGGEETVAGPEKDVSLYESGDGYETVNDPLTWEKINAFPVVHDGMTVEEGRKLVVDFFRFCKTAVWMPAETYEYAINENSTEKQVIEGYVKYAGLPYITYGTGNVYRLMDYMDPETHVVDIKNAGARPTLFGNQCSFGSYVGVYRVINSAKYTYTKNTTPMNGFVPVGDYSISTDVERFSESVYNTTNVMQDNGAEKMYESYAGLKKGDLIMYYTSAGHVVLISEDAHVVRDAAGKIDPNASYVIIIDQTATHSTTTNAVGDTYAYEANVDAKWTFQRLFNKKYVPYTFKEWIGQDPIESSKTECSYTGDTITLKQLYKTKVTSNYGILDLYASVYHSNGKEVYKMAVRSTNTSVKESEFSKPSSATTNIDTWGSVEDLDPEQEYTVKIYAQLSTGERPVLWEGKLEQ